MSEINLLHRYPKSKRNIDERANVKNPKDRAIARKFGKEFFDGERKHGYGGFYYNPKFWSGVVETFIKHWNIKAEDSILDVGCAKGFMLHDLKIKIPNLKIKGIDVSDYAIENSLDTVKEFLMVADAKNLPFEDKSFDIVISINTIHNLEIDDCSKAIREIERVSRKGAFITVDAYNNDDEKKRMYDWNLTAKTIMSVEEWKNFFKKNNYTGDYFWFIP